MVKQQRTPVGSCRQASKRATEGEGPDLGNVTKRSVLAGACKEEISLPGASPGVCGVDLQGGSGSQAITREPRDSDFPQLSMQTRGH